MTALTLDTFCYFHLLLNYLQELFVIDDLLSSLIGIEGRYISIKRVRGKEDTFSFQVDASMDLALQARIFVAIKNLIDSQEHPFVNLCCT